jgi:hypothetical protein
MTYSGVLLDAAGKPLPSPQIIEVKLWPSGTPGTTALCTSSPKSTPIDSSGRFSIPIDPCVATIKSTPDAWAEVIVGTSSLGTSKIGAVPYAVEAAHATAADTATNATTAATANAAGGALKTTVDGLSVPSTKITVNGIVAPFSVPVTTFTKIPFLTETYDDLDEFDMSTSTFSPSHAGDYEVCASQNANGNPTLSFELDVFINGTRGAAFANGTGAITGCVVIRMTVGQKLDVRLYAGPGASITPTDPNWDWMTIVRVR